MSNNIKVIFFTVFLLIISVTASHAVITLQDTRANTNANIVPFTQSLARTGFGVPGDFEVLMCATSSNGANSFLDPTPGVWSTLDSGNCGGGGDCIMGIFTRFDDSPDTTDNFCNWAVATMVFGAGSFRYRGVDIDNPIIDFDCDTGVGSVAVAPSIFTEANSVVIRVSTLGLLNPISPTNQSAQEFQGGFFTLAVVLDQGFVATQGASFAFQEEGETGTAESDFIISGDWRACTIALRMAPANIPTLSEWGMIAAAAGLMVVGVFFAARRKRLQASNEFDE